jgi:hypothetical protein
VPHDDVARLLGLRSENTLHKYYDDELQRGKAEANAKIAQCLFQQAINGNVAAAIFWTKSRMGWREVQYHEAHVFQHVEGLPTAELDRLIAIEVAHRETAPEDDRGELQ